MLSRIKHLKYWVICSIIIIFVALYYSSGYFFIYNNDAYVNADWVKIAPAVSGPISRIPVKNNQHVKKGELLVQLLPRPFEIAVDKALANLQQAKAQQAATQETIGEAQDSIKARQAKWQLATIELKRFRELYAKNAISKQQLNEKTEAFNIASDELAKAKQVLLLSQKQLAVETASISGQKSILNLAKFNLSQSKVSAPSDGYVNHLKTYAGDYAKTGETLFSFIKDGTWHITANIKETNLVGLYPNKKVWIYLSSRPWHFYAGKVESIGRGVARQPNQSDSALPYVKPVTDWVRYAYRIPVRIAFIDFPKDITLHMGTDARVIIFR